MDPRISKPKKTSVLHKIHGDPTEEIEFLKFDDNDSQFEDDESDPELNFLKANFSQNKNDYEIDEPFQSTSGSPVDKMRPRYESVISYDPPPSNASPAFPYQWGTQEDRIKANSAMRWLDDPPGGYLKYSSTVGEVEAENPLSGRSSSLLDKKYSSPYAGNESSLDFASLSSRVSRATADTSATIEERISMMSRVLEDIKQEGSSVDFSLQEDDTLDFENGYTKSSHKSRLPNVYSYLNLERLRLKTLNDLLETVPSQGRMQHLDEPTWLSDEKELRPLRPTPPTYDGSPVDHSRLKSNARLSRGSAHFDDHRSPALLGRPAWGGEYGFFGRGVPDRRRSIPGDWSSNRAVDFSQSNPNIIFSKSPAGRPRQKFNRQSHYNHVGPKVSTFRRGPSSHQLATRTPRQQPKTKALTGRSRSYDANASSFKLDNSPFDSRMRGFNLNDNKQNATSFKTQYHWNCNNAGLQYHSKGHKIKKTVVSKPTRATKDRNLQIKNVPGQQSSYQFERDNVMEIYGQYFGQSSSKNQSEENKQDIKISKKYNKFRPYVPISNGEMGSSTKQSKEEKAMWDRVDRMFDRVIEEGPQNESITLGELKEESKTNCNIETKHGIVRDQCKEQLYINSLPKNEISTRNPSESSSTVFQMKHSDAGATQATLDSGSFQQPPSPSD